MTCSRCGAEAVVKRDNAFYCGKCAMARDWEEIIAVVQNESAHGSMLDFNAPNGPTPATPDPVPAAAPAPSPAPAVQHTAVPPAPAPAAVSNGTSDVDLPADPFG